MELSPLFLSGFPIGFSSLFGGREGSEVLFFPVELEAGVPLAAPTIESDLFEGSDGILVLPTVGVVLPSCGSTQIYPSVVEPVAVNVIDFGISPRAGHPKPSKLVAAVLVPQDADHDLLLVAAGSDVSWSVATFGGDLGVPCENAGFRVIIEDASDKLGGQVFPSWSHVNGIACC